MNEVRDYQRAAVESVRDAWLNGSRAVCLVAPTGAGKTRMAEDLIDAVGASSPVLWVSHRRDLVDQTVAKLAQRFGHRRVGRMRSRAPTNSAARIQVGTVQSLLARGVMPPAEYLVLDEAHHYVARHWRAISSAYPDARCLGLTATPERADGTPLVDIFERIVVAARYSELIASGVLVPVCLHRPSRGLGKDLAEDPLAAWLRLSGGAQTFVFCARIDSARTLARRFRAAGISAAEIDEGTPAVTRDSRLARFRRGEIRVLTNVSTLAEGIDVPTAACGVLARNFLHEGLYLQCTGRLIRSSPDKPAAIIIDLCGASHRLGLPDQDRDYSFAAREVAEESARGGGEEEREEFAQAILDEPLEQVGVPMRVEPVDVAPAARKAAPRVMATRALSSENGGVTRCALAKAARRPPSRDWARSSRSVRRLPTHKGSATPSKTRRRESGGPRTRRGDLGGCSRPSREGS